MRYLFLLLLFFCLPVNAVNWGNGTTTYTNVRTGELTGVPVTGNNVNGNVAFDFSGYLTGNETITLSGDVSGSGTTAITTTVADDSHNHTNGTITLASTDLTDTGNIVYTSDIGTTVQAWSANLDNWAVNNGSEVQAIGSGGFTIKSSDGSDNLHLGNGGSPNATAYGGWNFNGATANTIASFGGTKTLTSLDNGTYPTFNELSYVKGVTSAIQTQIDGKQPLSSNLTTLSANDGSNLTGVDAATLDTIDSTGFLQNGAVTINNGDTTIVMTNGTVQDSEAISLVVNQTALSITESQISDLSHTVDTNANTVCSGTTTYLDGEGNCDDISSVYQPLVDNLTTLSTNNGAALTNIDDTDITRGANIVVFEATTDTATGDGKAYLVIPSFLNGMNLTRVHARVNTAGTTGTTDIQIHNVTDVVDMLSTKLTIDSGETGSDTAATPAVINTSNDDVATNDLLRVDLDAVSTTAAQGLIITLEFQLP